LALRTESAPYKARASLSRVSRCDKLVASRIYGISIVGLPYTMTVRRYVGRAVRLS
jgi:hypothetical protein